MDGKMNSSNSSAYRRVNLKIAPGAVVCEESILKGDISIGAKTIIHPRACILAEAGPIIIGEGNIIEEMATIANRLPSDAPEPATVPVQIIGNYNVFETDCVCESYKVGDNNILEAKAQVSREIELTNGCVIGAACSLTEQEVVPENTIVYGSQCQRREMNDKPYVIVIYITLFLFFCFMSPNMVFLLYCISASNWTVGLSAESTPELSPLSQIECKVKIWRTCVNNIYTHNLCNDKNKIICLIFTLIIRIVFIEKTLCLQFSKQICIFISITYNKIFLYYIVSMMYKHFNEF
ncbi:dynactin subunit 6 isoform X1 [Temnothorax longispinosus]|uniref:dynactin subunit 6 isoform X1 n=1 Tax=Temnothorax longispinosus TaxID=300112 RepID=UPI003A98DB70